MWGYICPSVRIPLFSIPQMSGRDSECMAECLNEIEIFFFPYHGVGYLFFFG